VLRNVTVKRSAEALQTISNQVRGGRYQEAWLLARDTELQLRNVAALTADEQMVQDADLFRRYQVTLGEYAPAEPVRTQPVQDASGQTQRWGPEVTPTLPAVEVK